MIEIRLPHSVSGYLYVGIPCLLVGLLLGVYVSPFRAIEVKQEITAGEVLNAFVTVILALLVADYLNRKAAVVRFEKDALIHDCAELRQSVLAVREFARKALTALDTPAERREVLTLIDVAFQALSALETDLSCTDSLANVKVMPVVAAMIAYKRDLTGGKFPQQRLDHKTYLRAERRCEECLTTIAKLRFELNRS